MGYFFQGHTITMLHILTGVCQEVITACVLHSIFPLCLNLKDIKIWICAPLVSHWHFVVLLLGISFQIMNYFISVFTWNHRNIGTQSFLTFIKINLISNDSVMVSWRIHYVPYGIIKNTLCATKQLSRWINWFLIFWTVEFYSD